MSTSGPAIATALCANALKHVQVISSLTEAQFGKAIGVHNGTFHCDEALATSMLMLLPQFAQHVVVRTRDTSILQHCDAVLDVGGVYDPNTRRFDHHQRGFEETFNEQHKTKLSSAGLVYKHFGKEVLQALCQQKLDDATLDLLYPKIYKNFVEHIDGIDNGVEHNSLVYEPEGHATSSDQATPVPVPAGVRIKSNYSVPTTLSARVSYLNVQWNDLDQSETAINQRFVQAMHLTLSEFADNVLCLVNNWLPAREIVKQAINNRFNTHPGGEIVYFPQYCPWKSHLSDLEKELLIENQLKFVLYNDATGNMVRVQAINDERKGAFANRKSLLKAWRGLRDQELSKIAGIDGCTFVHAAGFIGGNRTLQGALEMAVQSLEAED